MSDNVWYLIDRRGAPLMLVCASSPEAAVAAVGGECEVAVYVADYIGRFDVKNVPKVTRLSNANDPLRP